MTLNWRQALTSAVVCVLVVLGVDGLFMLFGISTHVTSAIAIGLGIGAGRLIERQP